MNAFANSLQRVVTGTLPKPWGDGFNPLIIIGLTEAVLDLGLTEEQLHLSIRSYARQLSSQVHPDRVSSISPERQRQIISAFNAIDTLEDFKVCLADFKNLRAEDRREIRILKQQIQSHNHLINALEDARASLSRQKRLFEASISKAQMLVKQEEEQTSERFRQEWDKMEEYKESYRKMIQQRFDRRMSYVNTRVGYVDNIISKVHGALRLCQIPSDSWWKVSAFRNKE